MKANRYLWIVAKYAVYVLVLSFSYVMSTLPAWPAYRPVLVLPMVVCLALYEGEFVGGLYGALAGLLLDYGSATIFGINAMLLLILGCAAGLISLYLFQNSLKSALILTAGMAVIHGMVAYFLLYGMWNLPGSHRVLVRDILPSIIATTAFALPYQYGVGFLFRTFEERCKPVGEMS